METMQKARFETLSDGDALGRMAAASPRLPIWARAYADSLPATTALQMNLEFIQRTRNPLGPVLSAELRWVVADANECAYARESAAADLAKAGVTAEQVQRLGTAETMPPADRRALEFARDLTLGEASITDEQVAELIREYGPDDAVAIVHTVAHANFQNRIFLALGLTEEPGGAVPARQVRPPESDEVAVRPRASGAADAMDAGSAADGLAPWSRRTSEELRDLLERQKTRTARIEKPDAVRLARLARPERGRLGRVAWGTVSMGYSPEMTRAWFQTMEAFSREANLDEVLAESIFWVVTRTNDCFY